MYHFVTKAETLVYLSEKSKEIRAEVLPLLYYTIKEWVNNQDKIWKEVKEFFPKNKRLIIRSSAKGEDSSQESLAGKYTSEICNATKKDFIKSVDNVIKSYGNGKGADEQFLIQPLLENVTIAGVAFTKDPNSGGNYYVINYEENGSTSSITSGDTVASKLFYRMNAHKVDSSGDERIDRLCESLDGMVRLLKNDAIDVEFAFCKNEKQEKLFILQARPLILKVDSPNAEVQSARVTRIKNRIDEENGTQPYLYGDYPIYSNMTDWNLAEMIGVHPKPLALSLYKELITDSTWAYQRDNYGYLRLRSFPLMVDFCGLPYIDARVSFNSFIPKELDPKIAEKLVNYYLDCLQEHPERHDKVEFDIVFSCYTFDLPKRIMVLKKHGFSQIEIDLIIEALRNLTNKIIDNKTGLWLEDEQKINTLSERYEHITEMIQSEVSRMYWLIEDCNRYGTLPFAGLARAGFVAVQLLQSMITTGILSKEEYDLFMKGVSTVGSQLSQDLEMMSKSDFLKKYGHLRPGTYDITSHRYDEKPGEYFDWTRKKKSLAKEVGGKFRLTLDQIERIQAALDEHGIVGDVLSVFSFIRAAIEGREYAKFTFTRSLSEILRLFGKWTEEVAGVSKEDASYANIHIVKDAYCSTLDEEYLIKHSIEDGKKKYGEGSSLVLPSVITKSEDVEQFFVFNTMPNYITQNRATGEIVRIDECKRQELRGKILLLHSADPGYDWIFSHSIAGFITEFGGANSHMAIRAGELSIPAVIGIGKKKYEDLKGARVVEIDSSLKKITVIK